MRIQNSILSECNVSETISAIEAKIARKHDIYEILRLASLLSTANSGIKQNDFDQIRRSLIMSYGYQEIATMLNMQDAHLMRIRDRKFDWNKIKQ